MAQLTFSFDFENNVGTVDFFIFRKDLTSGVHNPDTGSMVVGYRKNGISAGDGDLVISVVDPGDYGVDLTLVTTAGTNFTPSVAGAQSVAPAMAQITGTQNLAYVVTV